MPARVETLSITHDDLLSFAKARGIQPFGGATGPFTWVEPLNLAGPADIAFCRFDGEEGLALIRACKAGAVFVPRTIAADLPQDGPLYLPCEHPRLEILHLLKAHWRESHWDDFDPAQNPLIHPTARIAPDARIGPFTMIGPGVTIGPRTRIGSNCHIERAGIGADCIVANSVTIGRYGFGYEDDPVTGETMQFPHIGGVVIGDRVEIGSSTCVDRGSIGDTVIGDDCKIDNLVHVAHNVRMGRRCKVIALAIIGGSVTLGEGAWIAPAAAVRDWRKVGAGAVVGLGAIVTKDVPEGETVVGNPAKPLPKTVHRYK